jgi:hypothetical protein
MQTEVMQKKTRVQANFDKERSHTEAELQGVPEEQVMFLISGLFLSSGWGGLIALVTGSVEVRSTRR